MSDASEMSDIRQLEAEIEKLQLDAAKVRQLVKKLGSLVGPKGDEDEVANLLALHYEWNRVCDKQMDRAEKAEAEVAELRLDVKFLKDLADKRATELFKGVAEIAKLRLDKVRIDWLDANMTLGDLSQYTNDDPEDPGDHRRAIDAAMGVSDE